VTTTRGALLADSLLLSTQSGVHCGGVAWLSFGDDSAHREQGATSGGGGYHRGGSMVCDGAALFEWFVMAHRVNEQTPKQRWHHLLEFALMRMRHNC
jgi:hypothetical protein